jgi:hypothetical protein
MKQVIVDISPAGSVKVEAQGFNGVGCDKATEQIEIVLGGVGTRKKKRKPEFFASPSTKAGTKLTF